MNSNSGRRPNGTTTLRLLIPTSLVIFTGGVLLWHSSDNEPSSGLAVPRRGLALNHTTSQTRGTAVASPVYRWSVVPGGVRSAADVRDAVASDPVVKDHYRGLKVPGLMPVVRGHMLRYVSYRRGDNVYWTSVPVAIAEGEPLLSDGESLLRARCGNRLSLEPQRPTAPPGVVEPTEDELSSLAGDNSEIVDRASPASPALRATSGGNVPGSSKRVIPGLPATSATPASDALPMAAQGSGMPDPDIAPQEMTEGGSVFAATDIITAVRPAEQVFTTEPTLQPLVIRSFFASSAAAISPTRQPRDTAVPVVVHGRPATVAQYDAQFVLLLGGPTGASHGGPAVSGAPPAGLPDVRDGVTPQHTGLPEGRRDPMLDSGAATPEPSTLWLGLLGLCTVGVCVSRRHR